MSWMFLVGDLLLLDIWMINAEDAFIGLGTPRYPPINIDHWSPLIRDYQIPTLLFLGNFTLAHMFHGLFTYINGLNGLNCMGFHVGTYYSIHGILWAKNLFLHLSTTLKRAQKKPSKVPWFPSSKPSHLHPTNVFHNGIFHQWTNVREIFTKKKPSSNWVKAKNFIWCTFFFNFEIEKNIHQHQATNQPTIGWSYCSWVYLVEINQLLVSSTNQSVEKILWLVSSTIGWKTDPVKMGVFLSKLAVWIWWLMTKSASFT